MDGAAAADGETAEGMLDESGKSEASVALEVAEPTENDEAEDDPEPAEDVSELPAGAKEEQDGTEETCLARSNVCIYRSISHDKQTNFF